MRFRILIFGLMLFLSLAVFLWTKPVNSDPPINLPVTTVGLDDLHIRLKAPYGARSFKHALIVNDSSHHLLACELLFEFTTRTGEIHATQGIVAYASLLAATKPGTRETLLKSQPGIAPHSKLLFGMGMDPKLLLGPAEVPPLPTHDSTVEEAEMDWEKFEKLVIRLNAVVIEDGRALGPGADKFLNHLGQLMKEDK